jgi:hypothetical protein
VLGFFGFLQADDATASLREGFVVLNGRALTSGLVGTTSFLGVFTHEFGHFAGPLDHSQINGNIAADGDGAILPPGFSRAQAYDLYAPFTETLFPFIFDAPFGSQLAAQGFVDSGFFIATLDMDTQNALSNLYPSADYFTNSGSIEGRVVIRTSSGDIPITGINVVARRIDQGVYPPPLGTLAFTSGPALDADGVPESPQLQAATDSLTTVSSAVTGLESGSGTYRIQGLPVGNYLIEIQQINPQATGGSSIGPLGEQFPLPFQEFYNGAGESATDNPADFTPVAVTVGQVTTGIDIILNGFNVGTVAMVSENEPNHKTKKAQRLTLPSEVAGAAAFTDSSLLNMDLGSGQSDKIEDLYRFTVTTAGTYFILLESTSGAGDLDLYLFLSTVNKKRSSLTDPNLFGASLSASSTELIALPLQPGDYIIGVSAFEGSQNYRLRAIGSQ